MRTRDTRTAQNSGVLRYAALTKAGAGVLLPEGRSADQGDVEREDEGTLRERTQLIVKTTLCSARGRVQEQRSCTKDRAHIRFARCRARRTDEFPRRWLGNGLWGAGWCSRQRGRLGLRSCSADPQHHPQPQRCSSQATHTHTQYQKGSSQVTHTHRHTSDAAHKSHTRSPRVMQLQRPIPQVTLPAPIYRRSNARAVGWKQERKRADV